MLTQAHDSVRSALTPGAIGEASQFVSDHPQFSLGALIAVAIALLLVAGAFGWAAYRGQAFRLGWLQIGPKATENQPAVKEGSITSEHESVPAAAKKTYLRESGRLHEAVIDSLDYEVAELHHRIRITDDFSTVQETLLVIECGQNACGVLSHTRSSKSQSVRSYVELDFEAAEVDAQDKLLRSLPWLPSRDRPNEKSFLVFLFPARLPSSPPIRIRYASKWPRGAVELAELHMPDELSVTTAQRFKKPVRQLSIVIEATSKSHSFSARCGSSSGVFGGASGQREWRLAETDVSAGRTFRVVIERIS